jgi:hypothetical protein
MRVSIVVLAPLLLIELVLRFAGPHIPSVEPLLYHPKVVHKYDHAQTLEQLLELSVLGFRPGTRSRDFILNSRSLRAYEYSDEKPSGTLRVVALGDSFTFSLSVPFGSGWPVQLEALLEERLGTEVEVLNLGVPAVGVEFELRLWQLEGRKLHPDLVVLGFPVGSNFLASKRARRERSWSDHLSLRSFTHRFVRNAVRLKAFRSERGLCEREPDRLPIPAGASGVLVADVLPNFRAQYNPDRVHLSDDAFENQQQLYLKICAGRDMESLFEYTAQSLLRLRDEVVATGTEFVVLICPAELQVDPHHLRGILERTKLKPPPSEEEVLAPQEFLRAFFEREGIRYLDLLPAFRAAASEERLYGVQDSHWNVPGNLLAAEVLAAFLTSPSDAVERWPWQDQP